MNLHYNGDKRYLYVNKTEIYKFKVHWQQTLLWVLFRKQTKDFTKDKQSEISLNGTVYDISVNHSSVEKEDIDNIHEYSMVKNNIK